MSFKIVIDSCGELTKKMKESGYYTSIPLTLEIDGEQICDDEGFDQADFLAKMKASENCPRSSCPSPEVFREAYDCGADRVYAVTLSAELSGSYNSAQLGRHLLLEDQPDAKIYVFNSRSASVGETLIGRKILECEKKGMEFEQVIETVEAYILSMKTFFVLESLDVLYKNGRLSGMKAMLASALNIKPVMTSTDEGIICQLDQARGIDRAVKKMAKAIVVRAEQSGNRVLAIAHCNCLERALKLEVELKKTGLFQEIVILDTAGISTMYANEGGVIAVL